MGTWHGERVTVRPVPAGEADTFAAYQSGRVAAVPGLDEPTPGHWFLASIDADGQRVGEFVVHIGRDLAECEIGYHVRAEYTGQGIATEAAGLVVDHLFADHDVVRVCASVVPGNVASMRVLEHIGMRFETRAAQAIVDEGGRHDDVRFAMTADDRSSWLERPVIPPEHVELVEIDHRTAHDWRRLETHYTQQRFVSTVDESYTDALFPEPYQGVMSVPWMRGIVADGVRAGFTMVSLTNGTDGGWLLWRLLVDRMHQRRGIGERAIALVVEEARRAGVDRLVTSYVDERGGPEPFYERLGFVRTGAIVDGEVEAALRL